MPTTSYGQQPPDVLFLEKIPGLLKDEGITEDDIYAYGQQRGLDEDAISGAIGKAYIDMAQGLKPPPIWETRGPMILREVLPTVAGVATKSPQAAAVTGLVGEVGAREIELYRQSKHYEDLTFSDHIKERLMHFVHGAGAYAGGYVGTKYLPAAMAKLPQALQRPFLFVYSKLLKTPLEKMTPELRRLYKVLINVGTSPTPGQVTKGGFVKWAEKQTRSAWFGEGHLAAHDTRSIKTVSDSVVDYIDAHAKIGWNPALVGADGEVARLMKSRYGQAVYKILKGEMDLADDLTRASYDAYRATVKGKGLRVNAEVLREIITEHGDNMNMRPILSKINYLLSRQKKGAEELGEAMLGFDEAVMMTDEEVVKLATSLAGDIPVENATEILRSLNKFLGGRSTKGQRWAARKITDALRPEVHKTLRGVKGASEAFDSANQQYARLADRLYTDINKKLYKTLAPLKSPSKIIQIVAGGEDRADKLRLVKRFFTEGIEGETRLSARQFEEQVLAPLRHHFIFRAMDKDTGILMGRRLVNQFDSLGSGFMEEVFGEATPWVYDIARAMARLQSQRGGTSMWIKISQGSLLASSAVGGIAFDQAGPAMALAGTITIGPAIFCRMLTRKRLAQKFVEGITAPGDSRRWQIFAGMIAQLKVRESELLGKFSEEEKDFYYDTQTQSDLVESTEQYEEGAPR